MSDSKDNERVNEISRALQSLLSEPTKAPSKTTTPRNRKAAAKRVQPEKPRATKAKAKPKPQSKAVTKPKASQPAAKKSEPAKDKSTATSKQTSTVKAAAADSVRVLQSTDFALLAQRLRRALDDVKTGRVPTAVTPLRALEPQSGENHQLITDIKARLTTLSDEIDIARAAVAQKLLALDNLQRRLAFEVDDLLDQLAQRLDKNP